MSDSTTKSSSQNPYEVQSFASSRHSRFRRERTEDSGAYTQDTGAYSQYSNDDDTLETVSTAPHNNGKPKPKNTIEALGNLMEALHGVATMGTNTRCMDTGTQCGNKNDGSNEFDDTSTYNTDADQTDDDDDDDESASSAESSLPTLPDKIRLGRKSMPVRDDLTENSYAISLENKRLDREERERNRRRHGESRDDTTYTSGYTEYS